MSKPVFRRTIETRAANDGPTTERVTVTSFDDGRVQLTIDSLVGPVSRTISAEFAGRLSRLVADAAKFSLPQAEKESTEK